jgi:hypothetical protein
VSGFDDPEAGAERGHARLILGASLGGLGTPARGNIRGNIQIVH